MTEDIKNKLEETAAYIITKCARETTSGNYFIYPEDIPAEILPADLYYEHLDSIVKIMLEYEAIAEVDKSEYDSLDVMVYLDYCPKFEPDADERDDYPDDREILDPLTTRRVKVNYELTAVTKDENALFYSSLKPERDRETGCIGHLRADFGTEGNKFWSSWEDHAPEIKTQAFKDEFDGIINSLRENGILKNLYTMSVYCYDHHKEAKLNDGRDNEYGFKIKTDNHIYYLRCITRRKDYNLYCYAYDRSRLEKALPSLAEPKPTLAERLEAGKRKAAEHHKPDNSTQKSKKREGLE